MTLDDFHAVPAPTPKGALRSAMEEQVVTEYLPLADHLARQVSHHGQDLEDMMQVARLALVKAAQRFDPRISPSFVAFARPTVLGELKRFLRDQSWVIQPPREIQELQLQVQREYPGLCQRLGREPRVTELAAQLGRTPRLVAEAMLCQQGRRPDSLDVEQERNSLHEQLPSTRADEFAAVDDSILLGDALRELEPQEKLILRLRYFEDESQQRIGQRLRMSQVQVSRSLARILAKLQRHMLASRPAPQPAGTQVDCATHVA